MTHRVVLVLLSGLLLLTFTILGGATARASSFTINFTGTVTSVQDMIDLDAPPSPYIGQSVSGTIAMTGIPTVTNVIAGGGGNLTLSVFDLGFRRFEIGSGPSYAVAGNTNYAEAGMFDYGSNPNPTVDHLVRAVFHTGGLDINLAWQPTTQLATLAGFPSDDAAANAFFGVVFAGEGLFKSPDYKYFLFSVTSFTTSDAALSLTPIPAALPLMITAVAGLGFAGWRRRRQSAA
jgi:hypothetical protein